METGNKVWLERLEGEFTSSPILIDGKIYAANHDGDVFVIAAEPKFQLLAHNVIGTDKSRCNASPAVSDGQLFLRNDEYLYCIGKR